MSTTSMSLETLHFLLQHMDANRRFEVYQRCPSIREFEKSVPLKIESLVLREDCVIVNDITYKIGIIQRNKVGETPKYVTARNEKGGVPHEVDVYGLIDGLDAFTTTPGDVEVSEAMKHLATVLLGGRSSPIYLKKMHFNCRCVVRLPVNLKFHIEQLALGGNVRATLEALSPILREESYPLKKLNIHVSTIDDVRNPVVETAEVLQIHVNLPNILELVSSITNQRVHISIMFLFRATLEELIENWIELQRPIGFEQIIATYQKPIFSNEIENMLKRLNGVVIDEENVIIPMSNVMQLKVSYGPFPEFAPRSKWALKLLNSAVGHY
ncbi:unnamed protein product [Caenorhabditis brenneri]